MNADYKGFIYEVKEYHTLNLTQTFTQNNSLLQQPSEAGTQVDSHYSVQTKR
jgi:hypothetical protein